MKIITPTSILWALLALIFISMNSIEECVMVFKFNSKILPHYKKIASWKTKFIQLILWAQDIFFVKFDISLQLIKRTSLNCSYPIERIVKTLKILIICFHKQSLTGEDLTTKGMVAMVTKAGPGRSIVVRSYIYICFVYIYDLFCIYLL